ncbi:MAG: bifunctional DNA-formamidopyrimidine glycosylase/DNA-(apurinic or apyrimidinic site) lyase [Acidobacteriota bacterium]
MPELPEVEVVRRSLLPRIVGSRFGSVRVREARLRVRVDRSLLCRELPGRTVLDVRRRAKYLLLELDTGGLLMVHLGMTGHLGLFPATEPLRKHDHVVITVEGRGELRFNDARRFGLVQWVAPGGERSHPRLCRLGVEPLAPDFSGTLLRRLASGHRLPVKNFLMDSRRVVGIGNIYASEALWNAGVHPARPAGRLSAARWERLATAIRQVLSASIQQGGTTFRDFASADGSPGYFALHLDVYDRKGERCRRCDRTIRRRVDSGRSTYYCPGCQH